MDERRDDVVVEGERERQQVARHDRRQELREGDLPEGPPRRAVQVEGRLDVGAVHVREPGLDEEQHETDVEHRQRANDRVIAETDLRLAGQVRE